MHSEIGKIGSRDIDAAKRGEGGRGWRAPSPSSELRLEACESEDVCEGVLGKYLVPLFQLLHLTVLVAQLGLPIL